MSQYKYYFRKPKSEITKDILISLFMVGAIYVAGSSPYFAHNIIRAIKNRKKYKNKKVYDTFYRLKRGGHIKLEKNKHNVIISLTDKGKAKAGRFQIDDLRIKKPKKWDKKWRIVIFDISELRILQRNIFRGKLKELGFKCMQKSIWICPYKCFDEINLLRSFLGLSKKDVSLIVAEKIEEEILWKKKFKL